MFGCGHSVGSARSAHAAPPVESGLRRRLDRLAHLDSLAAPLVHHLREASVSVLAGSVMSSLGSVLLGTFGTTTTHDAGRVHRVPSDRHTVRLGVFDSTLPNLFD